MKKTVDFFFQIVYDTIVRRLIEKERSVLLMWTVVYIAKSSELAQKLKETLHSHNIMVMVRIINSGEDATGYEILVPDAEVEAALGIIIDES